MTQTVGKLQTRLREGQRTEGELEQYGFKGSRSFKRLINSITDCTLDLSINNLAKEVSVEEWD